jgi:hypothetical protein
MISSGLALGVGDMGMCPGCQAEGGTKLSLLSREILLLLTFLN